jgi:hypothetical protein
MTSRLRSVILFIGALLVPLGLAYGMAYGWVLRCACSGCRCGWGCTCPKYWTWVQAIGIFAAVAIGGAALLLRVRRRHLTAA